MGQLEMVNATSTQNLLKDPNFVSFTNGILDLRTNKFEQHYPKFFVNEEPRTKN